LIVPIPYIEDIKSSTNVTNRWKELESRDDNIPWFPVIWSKAPGSITHVRGEDDTIQVAELPDQVRVVVEEEDDIYAGWNYWNIWNYWNCWANYWEEDICATETVEISETVETANRSETSDMYAPLLSYS